VPVTGFVTEMNTCFKHIAHRNVWHDFSFIWFRGLSVHTFKYT
ncbi:MAG: hypothetical protein ACI971_000052, partial [Colwellia sp.]